MSTISFRHFLLTRYAVKDRSRALQIPLDSKWFENRLNLFTSRTFPSVKAQTAEDFIWLLFFSDEYWNEVQPVVDAIEEMANAHMIPIVNGEWINFDSEMRSAMESFLMEETHVISTRIDSDDAIEPDFLQLIQDQFSGQDFCFVNFEWGSLLSQDGLLRRIRDPHNQFCSVIERRALMKGILTWDHGKIAEVGPVIELQAAGRWTHVHHGGNASGQ